MTKHQFELSLAPHTNPEWSEQFIYEARMRDVSGDAIGDALAEVDAHVVDSGQDAFDAFGDPVKYAESVAAENETKPASMFSVVLPIAVQTVGMIVVLNSLDAVVAGTSIPVQVGQVLSIVLVLVAMLGLAKFATPVFRLLQKSVFRTWLGFMVLLALIVAVLFVPGTLGAVPAGPVLALGVVLLLAGTLMSISRQRKGLDEDPIVNPAQPKEQERATIGWVSALVVPVATVVMVGVQLAL